MRVFPLILAATTRYEDVSASHEYITRCLRLLAWIRSLREPCSLHITTHPSDRQPRYWLCIFHICILALEPDMRNLSGMFAASHQWQLLIIKREPCRFSYPIGAIPVIDAGYVFLGVQGHDSRVPPRELFLYSS
jgi:hypothetical protein